MSNFSIDLAAERIADRRTKEYFQEVLSSFSNGNFRSATVMLWTVVVCDLVYKLQDLRDLYADSVAERILSETARLKANNPRSPDWERILLDKINDHTDLLTQSEYKNLTYLQTQRHLAAHPTLDALDLLSSPNKETVRANMRNALEGLLLKPPVFAKRILEHFVSDLAERKHLLSDPTDLRAYIDAKYRAGLTPPVERALFKALWKFCFRTSNEDTDANRSINHLALEYFYTRDPAGIRLFIADNSAYFSQVASSGEPLKALAEFLSKHPEIFPGLQESVTVTLRNQQEIDILALCVFMARDLSAHIETLCAQEQDSLQCLSARTFQKLVDLYREPGLQQKAFALGSSIYIGSTTYDDADSSFARYVSPYIGEYDRERMECLLSGIESNGECRGIRGSSRDHPAVAERARELSIDLAAYPEFAGKLS